MKAKTQEHRQARDLYMQTEYTRQQIADLLSVNRRTVSGWIKDGHWEEMKLAARRTPMHLAHNVYNHIDQVELKIRQRPVDERCPTMEEIEMLRKLYNMMAMTADTRYIGNYVQTYEHLLHHVNKNDHEMAVKLTGYADEIIAAHCLDQEWDLRDDQEYINENLKRYEKERNAIVEEQAENSVGGECEDNVMLDKNNNYPAEPATAEAHKGSDNINQPPHPPISGISPADGRIEGSGSDRISLTAKYYSTLPQEQRPSPFRDGDTLWINDIEDLDKRLNTFGEPWGERKMGDRIRRFSDLK